MSFLGLLLCIFLVWLGYKHDRIFGYVALGVFTFLALGVLWLFWPPDSGYRGNAPAPSAVSYTGPTALAQADTGPALPVLSGLKVESPCPPDDKTDWCKSWLPAERSWQAAHPAPTPAEPAPPQPQPQASQEDAFAELLSNLTQPVAQPAQPPAAVDDQCHTGFLGPFYGAAGVTYVCLEKKNWYWAENGKCPAGYEYLPVSRNIISDTDVCRLGTQTQAKRTNTAPAQAERTDVYQQSLQILSGEKLTPLN